MGVEWTGEMPVGSDAVRADVADEIGTSIGAGPSAGESGTGVTLDMQDAPAAIRTHSATVRRVGRSRFFLKARSKASPLVGQVVSIDGFRPVLVVVRETACVSSVSASDARFEFSLSTLHNCFVLLAFPKAQSVTKLVHQCRR